MRRSIVSWNTRCLLRHLACRKSLGQDTSRQSAGDASAEPLGRSSSFRPSHARSQENKRRREHQDGCALRVPLRRALRPSQDKGRCAIRDEPGTDSQRAIQKARQAAIAGVASGDRTARRDRIVDACKHGYYRHMPRDRGSRRSRPMRPTTGISAADGRSQHRQGGLYKFNMIDKSDSNWLIVRDHGANE